MRKTLAEIAEAERRLREHEAQIGETAGDRCDWHDNAGFETAQRDVQMSDAHLARLKMNLKDSMVIKDSSQTEEVQIGNKVRLLFNGHEEVWIIGGCNESDMDTIISYDTPIGTGLLRMKVGEEKHLSIGPKGVSIKILEITIREPEQVPRPQEAPKDGH